MLDDKINRRMNLVCKEKKNKKKNNNLNCK